MKTKFDLDKELMYDIIDVRKRVSDIRNNNHISSIIEEIKDEEIPSEDEMKEMVEKVINRIKSFDNIYKDLTPAEEMSLLQEGIFASMIRIMEDNKK